MTKPYTIRHRIIDYVVITSLFLQSCGGLNNPIIIIQENQVELLQTDFQQIASANDIEALINKEFTAAGGHIVTFYEYKGQLQASIESLDEKYQVYNGVPVSIEKGADIISLIHLPKKVQAGRIHLKLAQAQGEQLAEIIIYKEAGLMGGSRNGNEAGKKGKKGTKKRKDIKRRNKSGNNQKDRVKGIKESDTDKQPSSSLKESKKGKSSRSQIELAQKVDKGEEHRKQSIDNDLNDYQNLPDLATVQKNPFEWCPKEITFMILERAAISNYLSDGNTGSLILVCRDWRDIIGQNQMKKSIDSVKDEYIYRRFLKGVLVYRPYEGSDVRLPISSLENPLEDTFDLSQCGDTGKYLSISTGYRKEKKAENEDKLEIWLTPRSLVKKEIDGSAQHYQEIFPSQWSEEAPIGILWSWGSWEEMEWYTYLTNNTMDKLGSDNLHGKWCESMTAGGHAGGLSELISWRGAAMQYFYVQFEN